LAGNSVSPPPFSGLSSSESGVLLGRYPSSHFAPSPASCDFLGLAAYKEVFVPGARSSGYLCASDDNCLSAVVGTLSDPRVTVQLCNFAKTISSSNTHDIGSISISNDLFVSDSLPLSPHHAPCSPVIASSLSGCDADQQGDSLIVIPSGSDAAACATSSNPVCTSHVIASKFNVANPVCTSHVFPVCTSHVIASNPVCTSHRIATVDPCTHTELVENSCVGSNLHGTIAHHAPCNSSVVGSSDVSGGLVPVSDNSILSHVNDTFLAICTYIDTHGIDTQLSIYRPLCSKMSAANFIGKIMPLLGRLSNHRCDKVSISGNSWNTHGLLGSNAFHYSDVHELKSMGASRILTSCHVAGFLELHTDVLECGAFALKWEHSHVCFWSYTEDRNCGGACICISKSFISTCLLCFPICFVPGRVVGVMFIFPNMNLLFICIHNCPTWETHERYRHFKLIHDCVPDCLKVTTILCGDLNFGQDTIRFSNLLPDASVSQLHKTLAALFERFFHDFVEIAHDCPTFMRGTYLSQLDHVWINMFPAILLDLTPSAAVSWQFGDRLGMASDHTPLRFSVGADSGNRVSAVPRWVPKHPDYKTNCERLLREVSILPGTPYNVLLRHKAIMKEAARLTLKHASSSSVPLCIEQKIYWAMTLLRHRHTLKSIYVSSATKSYKHLCSFVDNSTGSSILDIRQLSLHIDELQYAKVTGDLNDLPQDLNDSEARRTRLNRLGQYLTLWASRRRKISNLAIIDDNGDITGNAVEAAHTLFEFWRPNFQEKLSLLLWPAWRSMI
jgi:hypothetical protein